MIEISLVAPRVSLLLPFFAHLKDDCATRLSRYVFAHEPDVSRTFVHSVKCGRCDSVQQQHSTIDSQVCVLFHDKDSIYYLHPVASKRNNSRNVGYSTAGKTVLQLELLRYMLCTEANENF